MNEGRYRLIGSTASPYAIKFAALGAEHRVALGPILEHYLMYGGKLFS